MRSLSIEPETGLDLYPGCNQSKGSLVLGNGHTVTTVTYHMEQSLRSCADLEVAGNVELKKVPTPGPHEETKDYPSRAPIQTGPSVECNSCGNRVPANDYDFGRSSSGACSWTPHAASVLMEVLYGAGQVNRLARNITRWTTDDDKKLHRLMRYIHHTKHWRMIGWVGDSVNNLHLAVYVDADFSGCAPLLCGRHLVVT